MSDPSDLRLLLDAQAEIERITAELADVRAIVDRLHKTRDGVPLVPGDKFYALIGDSDGWEFSCDNDKEKEGLGPVVRESIAHADGTSGHFEDQQGFARVSDSYSTHEAAEAARRTT